MPQPHANPRPTIVPTRDGYDRWSEHYDAEDNPVIACEEPLMDRWLGDVAGLHVADVGCGTGRHALRLVRRGAMVTAVDFSRRMLAAARTKPDADRVNWIEHDLTTPLLLADDAFDRAICCLVMEHIDDMTALCCELGRICRQSTGEVMMTNMHPAMMLRGVEARFTDPASGEKIAPRSAGHRVTDYVMAILRAGLTICEMEEHTVDDALMARSPRGAKHRGWPILLAFRCKPGAPKASTGGT